MITITVNDEQSKTVKKNSIKMCMFDVHVGSIAQLCPVLWAHVDCGLLGSSVHGILQAGILEWAALPSSRGPS